MKNKNSPILILLSLVFSFMLWLVVMSLLNPEVEATVSGVPITIIGEARLNETGLSVVDRSDDTMRITFRGRRSDLAKLDNKSVIAEVDLTNQKTAGELPVSPNIKLPESVRGKVTNISQSPVFITLYIDRAEETWLKIERKGEPTAAAGYIRKSIDWDPREVKVSGPKSYIDKLDHAEFTIDDKNLTNSLDTVRSLTLITTDGTVADNPKITPDITELRVVVNIRKTVSVPLAVEFKDGGGITAKNNVQYDINPKQIEISGDAASLNGMSQLVIGMIDLSREISSTGSREFPILLPDGVESESREAVATVSWTITDAVTRRLSTSDISFKNAGGLQAGYSLKIVTNALDVTIRGPAEDVGLVESFNVRVVADLAGLALTPGGQFTSAATVEIKGHSSVGAVGVYEITLEIVEDEGLLT